MDSEGEGQKSPHNETPEALSVGFQSGFQGGMSWVFFFPPRLHELKVPLTNLLSLSENNLTDALFTKLTENLFVSSVSPELAVSDTGKLSIVEVDKSKVTGLQDALNTKADQTTVETLTVSINNISAALNLT